MYCSKCGSQLPDKANFCDACGAPVEQMNQTAETPVESLSTIENEIPKGQRVTDNIVLGTDGKYHWLYEFKLLKNPTILKLLWKIFLWIFVCMWLFLSIVNACDGHFNFKDFLDFSKIFLLILLGFEALVAFSYLIYAAIQGFKYCVIFDMDEEGITHTQMQKQFKKSQGISIITMLMGAAAGKPGVVGTGLLAATKSAMKSSWISVRSIQVDRKHNVIKVNERMNKNQVYAEDEDFQFVEKFIRSHVTKKCKISEKK